MQHHLCWCYSLKPTWVKTVQVLSETQAVRINFDRKDKTMDKAIELVFSLETCQERCFFREYIWTVPETLINFPSKQSIKNLPSCSGFYCGRKGHNYIVKNSSYPSWLRAPLTVTLIGMQFMGVVLWLAGEPGEAKGNCENSQSTLTTRVPNCHSRENSGKIQSHINISNREADMLLLNNQIQPSLWNCSCKIYYLKGK